MQIREIMTRDPACCSPDASLSEVARLMAENDCGCIPVIKDRSTMEPVGTITDRDIALRAVATGHDTRNAKASDIMTTDVVAVMPDMEIERCFDLMEDREIRRVLVVDDQGRCCGIVAQADIVQSPANPIRTNKVIREISEGPPSRHQRTARMKGNGKHQQMFDWSSLMSTDTLIPLAIGLGSGAALTYFLYERGHHSDMPQRREGRLDLSSHENFRHYADADHMTGDRQTDPGDRANLGRADRTDLTDQENRPISNTGRNITHH